ncbi:hypothetical protein GQ53DRAFT_837919 [Thozetella sp. PMI_491]|nr:hypothetical protein GQ53DRAFT_837919 [Thozetella sp. PMI_491]
MAQIIASTRDSGELPEVNALFTEMNGLRRSLGEFATPDSYQLSQNSSSRKVPEIKSLPSDLVLAILQATRVRRPIFMCSYIINDPQLLETLCRNVYFPITPAPTGQVTAMYGLLFFLLKEFIALQHPLGEKYDLVASSERCREIFTAGIETYDLLAIPCFENVLSLALGVTKAQEDGKLLLCCSLISAAASHCRILGYCRESSYRSYEKRKAQMIKRMLWALYTMDKNISLLEGRPSYFQDLEIDITYPELNEDPCFRPWDESFVAAIKLAKLQGEILYHLYSIEASKVNEPEVYELSRRAWDIMYYSTLTLVLRASSSAGEIFELDASCFQAARSALNMHLACFRKYENREAPGLLTESDHANWFLHSASFTPYLVIFLHAVGATSIDDVDLMDEIVKTLQRIRKTSQLSDRLYIVCAEFARLARRLVESQRLSIGNYDPLCDSLQLCKTDGGIFRFDSTLDDSTLPPDWMQQSESSEPCNTATLLTDWVDGSFSVAEMLETYFQDPENENVSVTF